MRVDRYNGVVHPTRPHRRTRAAIVGATIAEIRQAIGWTQRELSRRSGVSQSMISEIERAVVPDLAFDTASRLLEAMGARLQVGVDAPFLGDRPQRQREPAHARMAGSVSRRLRTLGWWVQTEVEIGGDRSRGWIDILAFHPGLGLLLIIELKTELHDMGAIDRTLGWYEREAWTAARRFGWRPVTSMACLLLLATAANDGAARFNREILDQRFPLRARSLTAIISGIAIETPRPATELTSLPSPRRALAMIDPRSRGAIWLRPTIIDGRRSPAPYPDYAGFMRACARSGGKP